MRFEWDQSKHRANRRKHGVGFAEAMRVFADAAALSKIDPRFDDGRWTTRGSADGRIFLVAHTYHEAKDDEHEEVIRIISARYATAAERRVYHGSR